MKWSAIIAVALMAAAITAMAYGYEERAAVWALLAVAVAVLSLHDRG